MVNVMQRHLVVANRETLMITFERRVVGFFLAVIVGMAGCDGGGSN